MGAHGDGSQNWVDSPPMLASMPGKLKKIKNQKKRNPGRGASKGRIWHCQSFTEDQEQFVVSWLIAFHDDRRIARDFLEFYPHFNGAVDKAECEQLIRSRCYQFRTDPKLPQYKIIREGWEKGEDDLTGFLLTHRHYRDHLRQNLLYRLEDLEERIEADEFKGRSKVARILIQSIHQRRKMLDNYEKLEDRR